MRNAIGFIIILWGLSNFLSQSFIALDNAATQSLKTIEVAAIVAQEELIKR
jgi:LEA14-like dessication related protein